MTTIGLKHGDTLMLLGRLLLGWIFLHEGFALVANPSEALAAMAQLGVNMPFALGAIALQIVAGISIVFGWYARLGALALAVFCILTAALFHTNFGNQNDLLHFEKDLAIAGGMIALAVAGGGRFSVDGWLAADPLPALQQSSRQR